MKSFFGLFTLLCVVSLSQARSPMREDFCTLPKETGNCKAAIKRFYYNKSTGSCEKFLYGGCMGNKNNFRTESECQMECHNHVCSLPKKTGECLAYFQRFYYNKRSGSCEKLIYGGCHGNANNFQTKQECMAVCEQY